MNTQIIERADGRTKTLRAVSFLLGVIVVAGISLSSGCSSTDAGLTTKVKAKLAADSTVKAYKIDVDTREKVVTLTGSVNRQVEKDQALALTRETQGVLDVVDMISVRNAAGDGDAPEPPRTIGDRIDDAGITMAVKGRLLDDPEVKGLQIDVDTRDGVVYLTGSVRSPAEMERAISLARNTENVRDVVSNITIEPS
jgi:hyperosmotically inducible protein